MRTQRKVLAFSALVCLACLNTGKGSAQTAVPRKYETVNLSYELSLSKCRNGACRVEPGGKGETPIQLEPEDRSYSWGCETATDRIGTMTYYFYFLASHDSRKGNRVFAVTLAGRYETARQVTWAQKSWTRTSWIAFPTVSISGNRYSDAGETITPTLKVKLLYSGFKLLTPEP